MPNCPIFRTAWLIFAIFTIDWCVNTFISNKAGIASPRKEMKR